MVSAYSYRADGSVNPVHLPGCALLTSAAMVCTCAEIEREANVARHPRMSTMCGTCGNMSAIMADSRHFIAHPGRNGQPCPGDHDYPAEREQAASDSADLTFAAISRINRQRCERWHPGFPNDGWLGSDWSNAMAGEAGETCNIVKKLRRGDVGIEQAAGDTRAELLVKLATEIGDTFLYLDLLAQFYGIDIGAAIAATFNRVSIREGFPERIDSK